jgi:superfamily II DNA/RNA helicase
MLDMGFIDDIEWVLSRARPSGQDGALLGRRSAPAEVGLAGSSLRLPDRITVRAGR